MPSLRHAVHRRRGLQYFLHMSVDIHLRKDLPDETSFPMMNVVRSIPMTFLPYMFFSLKTP